MYVCICNAIRDSELREAARRCQGATDAESLYRALGRPPQCGQCLEDAEDLIAAERPAAALTGCIAGRDWREAVIGA